MAPAGAHIDQLSHGHDSHHTTHTPPHASTPTASEQPSPIAAPPHHPSTPGSTPTIPNAHWQPGHRAASRRGDTPVGQGAWGTAGSWHGHVACVWTASSGTPHSTTTSLVSAVCGHPHVATGTLPAAGCGDQFSTTATLLTATLGGRSRAAPDRCNGRQGQEGWWQCWTWRWKRWPEGHVVGSERLAER
eukprot:6033569-Alexandrium_andersonii.AAC.1